MLFADNKYLLLKRIAVHTLSVFTVLWHREGGGRVEPERRLEGQQFTKLSRKYQHGWLYLQSINFDKHLPQSTFTGHFLDDDFFCFGIYVVNYSLNQPLPAHITRSLTSHHTLKFYQQFFISGRVKLLCASAIKPRNTNDGP